MTSYVKTGDWLIILGGLVLVAALFSRLWGDGRGGSVIIRSGGKVVSETPLGQNRSLEIQGPLGATLIEIHNHRVRVARDPSPRQYCVKQGWLSHAGEAALCLPNQVAVEITGADKRYDSLAY